VINPSHPFGSPKSSDIKSSSSYLTEYLRWVLTAAHCVYGRSSRRLNVVLGDHNVKSKDSGEKTMKVCSVITHPYYSNHHTKDDIALLRLCKNVEFSPVIQPIALAKPHEALDRYQKVKVSGWGVTKEGGRTSTILMHVDVVNIPIKECRRTYPWLSKKQGRH
jgi:secreted trypsin-like serine protease